MVVEELGIHVRRHRPRAAGAARHRLGVRQRSLGAHRRDRGAAAQRAHRAAHAAGAEGEHPLLRPRPRRRSPAALRGSDKDLRTVLERHAGRRPRGQTRCSRAWSPPCRCSSATWSPSTRSCSRNLAGLEQLLVDLPDRDRRRPHREPGDGYGHINLQFNYSVRRAPRATSRRASGAPPPTPADAPIYPAKCESRRAVRHARLRIRARPAGQRVPAARLQWRLRPGTGLVPGAATTGQPMSSSAGRTCRSLEAMRGSGCWSGPVTADDPGPGQGAHAVGSTVSALPPWCAWSGCARVRWVQHRAMVHAAGSGTRRRSTLDPGGEPLRRRASATAPSRR